MMVRGTINGSSGQILIPPANPYKHRVAGEFFMVKSWWLRNAWASEGSREKENHQA